MEKVEITIDIPNKGGNRLTATQKAYVQTLVKRARVHKWLHGTAPIHSGEEPGPGWDHVDEDRISTIVEYTPVPNVTTTPR